MEVYYFISFGCVAGAFLLTLWLVQRSNHKNNEHIQKMTQEFRREYFEIAKMLKAESLAEYQETLPHPPVDKVTNPVEEARRKENIKKFASVGRVMD